MSRDLNLFETRIFFFKHVSLMHGARSGVRNEPGGGRRSGGFSRPLETLRG